MKTLLFVRHGNTFRPDEISRRVGRRTDLHLVEEERSRKAARNLLTRGLMPGIVFSAPLLRTQETAAIIIEQMALNTEIQLSSIFSEIDYGDDENKTEDEVIVRLGRQSLLEEGKLSEASEEDILTKGEQILELWNSQAIPPSGWIVDTERIISDLRQFASGIGEGEVVLVVSSNGIIRFTPHILPEAGYADFVSGHTLKVTTGGICVFTYENEMWHVNEWNIKP